MFSTLPFSVKTNFAIAKSSWVCSQGLADVNRRKTTCFWIQPSGHIQPQGGKWWSPCRSKTCLLPWERKVGISTSVCLVGIFLPSWEYQGLCGRWATETHKSKSPPCFLASSFHPFGCFQRKSDHWLIS